MKSSQPLSKQLYSMTWPMLFGILAYMSFQLIDSIFIGQLGLLPLAAQGFTMPIGLILVGFYVGLGIATTAIISRALGANEHTYAKQLAGFVILIGCLGIGFLATTIYFLRGFILNILGVPEEIRSIIDSYWIFWLISAWLGSMNYTLSAIFRSNGNTIFPGTVMIIACIINLLLDPILIFVLDLGINGAAIASILSFFITIVITALKLIPRKWVTFKWQNLNKLNTLKTINHTMIPAMISQLLPPIASVIAIKILAIFGSAAVGAWAIGSNFEFFTLVAVLALTMAMPPMIGKLLGQKRLVDIHHLIRISCRFVLLFQLGLASISIILSQYLSRLMSSEASVSAILDLHLSIIPLGLAPLGVNMIIVSALNALGQPFQAVTVSSVRLFVFYLPSLWIGAQIGDIKGLLVGAVVGNILAGSFAWFNYKRTLTKLRQCYTAT